MSSSTDAILAAMEKRHRKLGAWFKSQNQANISESLILSDKKFTEGIPTTFELPPDALEHDL